MKKTIILVSIILISIILVLPTIDKKGKQDKSAWPVLKGPYLGQAPPGKTPKVFAPGILSRKTDEQDIVFSGDGLSVYFTFVNDAGEYITKFMKTENGIWTKPYFPDYMKEHKLRYPNLSHDGKRLIFVKKIFLPDGKYQRNIMIADIISPGIWGEPESIGSEVNSGYHQAHPSLTKDATLYFYSDRAGSAGKVDIYFSSLVNGKYQVVQNPGSPLNSDINEFNPCISPDEDFIIFNSADLPDKIGGHDLYISFRNSDLKWTKPINMGENINTESSEYKPFVTYDGNYFFFSSNRGGSQDIYWVDAKIIDDLKPDKLK